MSVVCKIQLEGWDGVVNTAQGEISTVFAMRPHPKSCIMFRTLLYNFSLQHQALCLHTMFVGEC